MIKKIIAFALVLLVSGCGNSDNTLSDTNVTTAWPTKAPEIFISTDFHYQTIDNKYRPEYLDEILDTLFYETAGEVLLLAGDNTNNGKLDEHLALIERLKEAEETGTQIYVTMGNHDVGLVSNSELKKLYADFGFAEAISQDTDSMSYLAQINDEVLVLSIDTTKKSTKTSEYASYLSEETLSYIKECIDYASKEGLMIIPFGHYNVLKHAADEVYQHYNIENQEKLVELFKNANIPVYMSGHRHSSFQVQDENFYEVVVDMPINYPYRYTSITLNPDKTLTTQVLNLDIESYALEHNLNDTYLLNFSEHAYAQFVDNTINNGNLNTKDFDVSDYTKQAMIDYFFRFSKSSRERTLHEDYQELLQDEMLQYWIQYEDINVFGRWIPWILEHQTDDSVNQTWGPF